MNAPSFGRVYLVDDNPDIRHHLAALLRKLAYTVEPYADASEFLRQSVDASPAVLVLDVRMPGMTGVELQARLHDLGRHTPIVFMSGESQSQEIIQAMKGGAIEFLWKPFQIQALTEAIERGLSLDGQRRALRLRFENVRRKVTALSAREWQVFMLMLQGQGNKGIGEILDIQPDTIKKHRANILQKMQVNDLAELMTLCQGLDLPAMVAGKE